jgi:REP element-mobilizing transposase RayT
MPRRSKIDAPGALHHIIVRGIERSTIFKDNTDRLNFLDRRGAIIQETKTCCLAWALIPNHFHLLVKTGDVPMAVLSRQLNLSISGISLSVKRGEKIARDEDYKLMDN